MTLEARWFQGELKKHDAHLRSVLQKGTVGVYDFRIGFVDADSSCFSVGSRHPVFGVGFAAVDYSRALMIDEPRSLGNIYSLYGYIDRTLFQFKSIGFGYDLESGVAYNTDPYDSVRSPNKIMSSSAFMIYVGLGLKLKHRLSEHWEIGVSAGAKHYSNGKYGIWNKGMNNLGGDVSLRYYFSPPVKDRPRTPSPFERYFYWHLFAGGGLQTYLEDLILDNFKARNKKYPVYGKYFISGDVLVRLSRRYGCGLGLDLFYVPSLGSFKKLDEYQHGKEVVAGLRYEHFSAGIAINQELYYKRFAITASLGYYLYRKLGLRENENSLYQRFGYRYYFPRLHHLFVGYSIKAHYFHDAEYFEFSIGKTGGF